MTWTMAEDYAEMLGFRDADALMEASECVVAEPGDIDWYVTACPDGRYAAWDDAEWSKSFEVFATREEAVAFQRDGLEASGLSREEHWVGAEADV